ncbi:hypothetical protein ACE1SV_60110 [Streptomyces sennicomposti]
MIPAPGTGGHSHLWLPAAAKKRGDTVDRAPRRRRQQGVRREGREPTGFAAVLQGLMADRAWELPAADGNVLNQWHHVPFMEKIAESRFSRAIWVSGREKRQGGP